MKRILLLSFACMSLFAQAQVSLLKDLNGTSSSSQTYYYRPLGVIDDKAIYQYYRNGKIRVISLKANGQTEELDSLYYSTEYDYNAEVVPGLHEGKLVILLGQSENHVILTDGTSAGTTTIVEKDGVSGFTRIGSVLYVSNYDNIRKIDLATQEIEDLPLPTSIGDFSGLGQINDSICLFAGFDRNDDYRYKVFRYNLLTGSVKPVKTLDAAVDNIEQSTLRAFGNKVAFIANGDDEDVLIVSDGTEAGTAQKAAFEYNYNSYNPYVWNGKYFFCARAKGIQYTNWTTLWATDGTAATELQTANDDTYLINPFGYLPFNGQLYYIISGGGYPRLCRTNGTVAGTTVVTLPYANGQLSVSGYMAADADKLYFGGWVVNSGKEGLFSYSKSGQLQNYYWGADIESFQDVAVVKNRVLFKASTDATGLEFYILGDPEPNGLLDAFLAKKETVALLPNPATNLVRVHTAKAITRIELWSQTGLMDTYSDTEIVSTAHLPRGMYLVKVLEKDGAMKTGKLILE